MSDENFGIVVEINPRPALSGADQVDRALASNEGSARQFEKAARESMRTMEREAKQAARAAVAAAKQAARDQEESAKATIIAAQRRAKERERIETEAARRAAAAAKQSADAQRQAQAGLARAYRDIVGPAAEYNRKLAEAVALERQGAITARQRAQYVAQLQREMRQHAASQQGGVRGALSGALSSQFGTAALAGAGVGMAATAAREVVSLGDSYIALSNQIRQATSSEAEMVRIRERLFATANRARVSVESLTQVYAQARLATKELGTSQADLLRVSELLAKATRGVNETNRSAGLTQFSQALTKGKLQAEELMSIMENIPRVGELLAKGMGVSIGELRKMAESGKVDTQAMLDAIMRVGPEIDQAFSKSAGTSAESWVVLKNQVLQTVGGFAEQIHLNEIIAKVLAEVGGALKFIGENVQMTLDTWKKIDAATGGTLGKLAESGGLFGNIDKLSARIANNYLFGAEVLEMQTAEIRRQTAAIEERERASMAELDRMSMELDAVLAKANGGFVSGHGLVGNFIRQSRLAANDNQARKDEKAARTFFGLDEKAREQAAAARAAAEATRELGRAWDRFLDETGDGAVGVLDRIGDRLSAYTDPAREFAERTRVAYEETQKFGDAVGRIGDRVRETFFGIGESVSKAGEAIMETVSQARPELDEFSRAMTEQLGGAIMSGIDALVDYANGAKVSFGGLVQSILVDLEKLMLKLLLVQGIRAAFGATPGGFGASLIQSLGGFAAGGSFTVPGGPGAGTDSVPVAFRATPGERVTITPPGGGGGGPAREAPISVRVEPVIVHDQHAAIRSFMSSGDGHRAIVEAVAANPGMLRAALAR